MKLGMDCEKPPKVSVLIPTYNYGRYLGEAIESVLNQTFVDYELIIVDNCSTDGTPVIMEDYCRRDGRIRYYRNASNIGMYRNYNQALMHARGEYIKFLNADDTFEPTLLEKFVHILETYTNVVLVTSHRQYFGSRDDVLTTPFNGLVDAKTAILSSLERGNWIGEPTTVMLRRDNMNLGLFDISFLMFADQDMWLRQLRTGDMYVVAETLSYFRIHEDQGTVYLNDDREKEYYNMLQYAHYVQFCIISNRFGYDLLTDAPQRVKNILRKARKQEIKIRYRSRRYALLEAWMLSCDWKWHMTYGLKALYRRLFKGRRC